MDGVEPSHDYDQTIPRHHSNSVLVFFFFSFPILWLIMVDPGGDLSTICGPVNQVRSTP
jgi:hypothetical protein